MKIRLFALVLLLLVSAAAQADVVVVRGTATTTAAIAYTAPARGSEVIFVNTGTADIFIGNATVTTALGFEAKADVQVRLKLLPRQRIYVIVAAATETYQVVELPQR